MSDVLAAAPLAVIVSIVGTILTFVVGIRSVKRSVLTASGTPLGPALDGRLEQIERRLTRIEDSLRDVRDRLAFEEGRSWPTHWPPRGPD
jgi:hypothetical protein